MTTAPVAMITGAGSGIGRATALQLARRGWRLGLLGRRRETLEATADLIAAHVAVPQPQIILPADVALASETNSAVDQVAARFGRVDALVNNAALPHLAPVHETTDEQYRMVFEANVVGPAHLVARLWPFFVSQAGGTIVNISSMATMDPYPGLGAYAASKAALESLTRSIANEGRSLGIRAFAIAPGAVETPMLRSIFSVQQIPPARTLEPDAIAKVIVECVLGEHHDDSGKVIYVRSP
jgi:NAD(P)-dependent dehydrogenase (short-subunit alcohol dehydrogenase family)